MCLISNVAMATFAGHNKSFYWVQAMFIPSPEALDTSYFESRYIWNPEDDNVNRGSDFDDLTETCSSGSFNSTHDEDVCIFLLYNMEFLFLYDFQ